MHTHAHVATSHTYLTHIHNTYSHPLKLTSITHSHTTLKKEHSVGLYTLQKLIIRTYSHTW